MAHRFRLYPTKDQHQHMLALCADARAIWNLAVEQNNFSLTYGRRGGRAYWPTPKQRGYDLTEARDSVDWIGNGNSMVQGQALRDFEKAKQSCFNNPLLFGQPNFRKKDLNNGFNIISLQRNKIKLLGPGWAAVQIPGRGETKHCWVKVRLSKRFNVIKSSKSCRVKYHNGQWHVSFVADQTPLKRKNHGSIGLDMGVVRSVTMSNGQCFDMPSPLSPGEKEHRLRMQRRVSKQVKGSNRHARTKGRIAKSYEKDANRRKDWIEKTTTNLVSHYDFIAIENLHVKSMMKSAKGTKAEPGSRVAQKRGLNRSIQTQSWGLFRTRLEQKASISGTRVIAVPAANTSRTCPECSYCAKENRENQAVFVCKQCGHSMNADVVGAKNVLTRGLGLLDVEVCSSKPVKRQSLVVV